MQRAVFCVFTAVIFCLAAFPVYAGKPVIRFYSEIAAPFYWLDDEGEAQGASVDLANAIAETAGLNATIEHMAWARAYYETTHHANVVLTSVLRTPEREPALQWLGLVHTARAAIIRLKSTNISITNLEQAKQYRLGTIRGYGAANYLLEQGFTEKKNLYLATDPEQLWSLLYSKRIDLVLSNLITDRYEIASIGLEPDKVAEIYNVEPLHLQLQMATGLTTPQDTVTAIRSALTTLKENGEYARIMRKWKLL